MKDEKERERLSKKYHGKKFEDLCWRRQESIKREIRLNKQLDEKLK